MVKFLNNKRRKSFLNFGKTEVTTNVATQNDNKSSLIKQSESFRREVDSALLSNKPQLNKRVSIKKMTSTFKKNINSYIDPLNKEFKAKLLPSPVLNSGSEKPFINGSYIHSTDEEQLEDNIIEHKIQQKLNIFLNIYNPAEFKINLDVLDLNTKKKFFSNLTYIETLFHYDNERNSIESTDLKKIENVDRLVYEPDYNIFTTIEDINPSSTKQVIRGLRIHLKNLIEEYHQRDLNNQIADTYEGIFSVWDDFNNVFTFEKMLEIENNLKVLFPRKGCSLSEIYLQYKLYSIFNSKDLLANIKDCFLSLIYLFLLNDGLMFWDEYLKILTIDEDVYKSFPQVLVYDNLVLVFEFLEMLIFLIGQFSYKSFMDIIQYLKHFSLIFFSLENCLDLKNDHRFKDLKEFKKVTDKLSNATLIILEKYLLNLSKDNQLNDFLILEKLTEYLGDTDKFKNERYSKKILTLSQPILRNSEIPETKYKLVSTVLTNLNINKKFINGEKYFVSDILIHFLKFLPNNFKQFHENMINKDKYIKEFALDEDDLKDDVNVYIELVKENNLKVQANSKNTGQNFDIRKFLFNENDQYRLSDWIDINEFSEFGQSLFLAEPKNKQDGVFVDTPSEMNVKDFNAAKNNINLDYTAIEVDNVENWVIRCFQNNHPLIFPYHLNHKSNKIYQLKQEYSTKLDIDFVYFNFLKTEDKQKRKHHKRSQEEFRENINAMNLTLDNFSTPVRAKERGVGQVYLADFSGKTLSSETPLAVFNDSTSNFEDPEFENDYSYLCTDLSINKVNEVKVPHPVILDNISYDDESHYTIQTPALNASVQSDYMFETPHVEHAKYFKAEDNSSISPSLNLEPNTATRDTYEQFVSNCSA